MNDNLLEKKNGEGEKISPYWAGRRKQEERDQLMKLYTDKYRVLTVELMIGLLNMDLNPSSRRIIETRYKRLVEGKYVRQIRKGFVTYYVSPSVVNPTTPLYSALCLSSFAMGKIGPVITPLHPRNEGQDFFNGIRPQGQDHCQDCP